ncbi:MAG: hypothetical protein MUC43_16105 [Pirellula sp.]|nr:hypothetical protein [Pirellula sp.]
MKSGNGKFQRVLRVAILAMITIPLLVVSCYLGLHFIRKGKATTVLNDRLNALRAKGLPVDGESLKIYYENRTDSTFSEQWMLLHSMIEGDSFQQAAANLAFPSIVDEIPALDREWSMLADADKFLKEQQVILAAIHELSAHNSFVRFARPYDYADMIKEAGTFPNISAMRDIGRLLKLEHEVALRQRDSERECRAIQSILGTAIAIHGEPIIQSRLVGFAIHGLAIECVQKSIGSGSLSEEYCQKIMDRLSFFDDYRGLAKAAIAGERALALPVFMNPSQRKDIGMLASLTSRPIDALLYLEETEKIEQAIDLEFPDLIATLKQLESDTIRRLAGLSMLVGSDSILTDMQTPMLKAFGMAVIRSELQNRLTKAALAVRLFQLRKGEFPQDLSELSQIDFDSSLISVLDGGEFGYRRTDNEATLWGYEAKTLLNLTRIEPIPNQPPSLVREEPMGLSNDIWVWSIPF